MTARPRSARAFTLLEAIIAIVILTSVAMVCLQLRAQSAAQAARLRDHQSTQRGLDALLTMAEARLLPDPEGPEEDDPSRRIEWRGEHLGRPYVCTRVRQSMPNPIADAEQRGIPAVIVVDRYSVEYNGDEAEIMRPVRIARSQREVVNPDEDGS